MKKILLFGAGKSATSLINYLSAQLPDNDWTLTVCDADVELASSKTGNAPGTFVSGINAADDAARMQLVNGADLVISMLPPTLHFLVARDCLEAGKHLLTASYIDENIRSLQKDIEQKDLLFLCEMGLDPGIDHMSAMRLIDEIRDKGGKMYSFISHCGGLVAPESDNNPWHYKITWNPRNIVRAGSDGAEYRKDNKTITAGYPAVFRNCPEVPLVAGYPLCWYPNRDSLQYISLYGLEEVSTFIRTTLRHPAFCRGWNKIVNIGLTSTTDGDEIKDCRTYKEWFEKKTARFTQNSKDWNNYLQVYITDPFRGEFHKQLLFLGIESNDTLPTGINCSADILQFLLEKKLAMANSDHDMIVMLHELEYVLEGQNIHRCSALIVKGDDGLHTAMAKTVGLPLGIAAKLILQGNIPDRGLRIPLSRSIYLPVLAELEEQGIRFVES